MTGIHRKMDRAGEWTRVESETSLKATVVTKKKNAGPWEDGTWGRKCLSCTKEQEPSNADAYTQCELNTMTKGPVGAT